MVQLHDDLVDRLDREATRRGVSRSAVIREAVELYLANDRENALTARIVAAYRKTPQRVPDEWGDPAADADRSTLETLQRLDAEERASGADRW